MPTNNLCLGQWLPVDETIVAQFRNNLVQQVKNKPVKVLIPSVRELAILINDVANELDSGY